MATREQDGAVWDTGAQFFTVRSAEFAAEVGSWRKREWCRGFDGHGDGYPRYVGTAGMNGLVADMAARLPCAVHSSSHVERIERAAQREGFVVHMEGGARWEAQHVVLTCPVPQSLALVAPLKQHIDLTPLQRVNYDKTLSLQLLIKESDVKAQLPAPGARQKPCEHVHFVASNKQKGISKERECWTVHMDPAFSDAHYELTKDQLEPIALRALAPLIGSESIESWSLHRWRYAIPAVLFPERFYECRVGGGSLLFCGDAFQEARVEGAYLSGATAGNFITARLAQSAAL